MPRYVDAEEVKHIMNQYIDKTGNDVFTRYHITDFLNEADGKFQGIYFSLDEVADIIYDLLGDECACNFNDIDEWMCGKCAYAPIECPNPKEHLGCWKQYLITKRKELDNIPYCDRVKKNQNCETCEHYKYDVNYGEKVCYALDTRKIVEKEKLESGYYPY